MQEKAQDLLERDPDFGSNMYGSLAKFDPVSCSWRTSQLCLDGDLESFSETWPRSGMMRGGIAYPLPPLAPRMTETASGLLPTVIKADGTGQASIICSDWQYAESRNGKLRRIGKSGTWSLGLSRTVRLIFGKSLTRRLAEWMMGFPEDWTAPL